MKLKKLFCCIMVVVFALSFFACGPKTPTTPDTPDVPDNPDPGGGEEIVWEIPEDGYSLSDRIMYVRDYYNAETNTGKYATGPNAAVDTTKWKIGGTDLGFPFYDPDLKRLYVSFGDTFTQTPMGGTQNSNATLYTDNLDFSNGIMWEGVLPGQNGTLWQVTPVARGSDVTSSKVSTTIPTGTIVLDGTYYMFYMEVDAFDPTGEWGVYANRVMKSTDQGNTWTRVSSLEWVAMNPDDSQGIAPGFAQIFPLEADDGYVYIYGIPAGRSGGVQLGRVKKENFENFEEYEYLRKIEDDGTVDWRKGTNGLKSIKNYTPSYIVSPSCGEICVTYNKYLQRYTMFYMMNNSSIVMRRSVNPWGEWSSPDTITNQSKIVGLYGSFTHPVMSTHDGKRIYMFVSQWLPVYNVHFMEIVFN